MKSGVGKPILIGSAIFLAALFLGAGFREFVWSLFSPASIVGDTVDCMSDDLETISRKWFEEYFSDLEGWTVPYNYRIEKAEITSAEILTDLEEPYIQLDYQVYAASANNGVMYNLELMQTNERRVYTGLEHMADCRETPACSVSDYDSGVSGGGEYAADPAL